MPTRLSAQTCNIETATTFIQEGGVIAYPTEAVYGLGCDPSNTSALLRLLKLKNRAPNKGLILIASDQSQLLPFIEPPDDATAALMSEHWPGPVTLVVQAKTTTSPFLTGGRTTLAVRVSNHPVVQQLCMSCDHALVSTSANISGQEALRDSKTVLSLLGEEISAVVEGHLGNSDKPSRIIDAQSGAILRS